MVCSSREGKSLEYKHETRGPKGVGSGVVASFIVHGPNLPDDRFSIVPRAARSQGLTCLLFPGPNRSSAGEKEGGRGGRKKKKELFDTGKIPATWPSSDCQQAAGLLASLHGGAKPGQVPGPPGWRCVRPVFGRHAAVQPDRARFEA
jgi:hypothetical protein